MSKFTRYLLLLAVLAGGAWLAYKYAGIQGLENLSLDWGSTSGSGSTGSVPGDETAVRVATFNVQVFGQKKLEDAAVMQVLAETVRRFDVVAIQEIRSQQQDVMPRFTAMINAGGRKYDFIVGPRLGRTTSLEQYAFVFDTERIEHDPSSVYTVGDPGDRLHREPLVASFRARGPPPEQAFTFTLVNVHTDPDSADLEQELAALDDVVRAVRSDRRGEDDVIVLGDFNADHEHLGELGAVPGIAAAIRGVPTNTRKTEQYDNVLFHGQATVEFTGRSGVLDLLTEFKLTPEQALDVSDHFPVWAEFSVYEGGRGTPLAARPQSAERQ
ncbi:MAG: endonuclease/exonuclease/phosphatase family protein [Planctomycetia bacterium]|nr:endonuclease/exonuclease/phosphatase family protein [Planctomycetia bacterium]